MLQSSKVVPETSIGPFRLPPTSSDISSIYHVDSSLPISALWDEYLLDIVGLFDKSQTPDIGDTIKELHFIFDGSFSIISISYPMPSEVFH